MSPPLRAKSCAFSATALASWSRYGLALPPLTRGWRLNSWWTAACNERSFTPSLPKINFVTFSPTASTPANKWTGVMACCPFCCALSTACWTACCALIVKLSKFIYLLFYYYQCLLFALLIANTLPKHSAHDGYNIYLKIMTTCAVHTDPLLPKRAEDNIYLLTLVNITIVKRTFVK